MHAEGESGERLSTAGPRVIALSPERASAVAAVLARAFAGDRTWGAVLPDEAERRKALPLVWRALVGYSLVHGSVWTTAPLEGVLCLLPPHRNGVSVWGELRTGLRFSRAILSLSSASRRRFLRFWPRVDAVRRRAVKGPYAYVWVLGVDPDRQGQGVGSALLEAACARCDEAGLVCVLETEAPRNVPFYERHGFRVVRTETVAPLGVRVWVLLRRPGTIRQHDAARLASVASQHDAARPASVASQHDA